MNLIDLMYEQKSYGQVLNSLGIDLDQINLIPFTDGQTLIADLDGNTEGFITENIHGGITVTDENMNEVGSTHTTGDITIIQDNYAQQIGMVQENVHGGLNLYDDSGQLDIISTDNMFYGQDYYDSNMLLLGSSDHTINDVTTFSMNESVQFTAGFENILQDIHFSDLLATMDNIAYEGLESVSEILDADIWSMGASELFDFFEIF